MKRNVFLIGPVLGFSLLMVCPAVAQQQSVIPLRGQSVEQQKIDENECHSRAVSQTNYDPMAVARDRASGARSAGRDSTLGPALGSFGSGSTGAAVGAAAGSAAAQAERQRQQARTQRSAGEQNYLRARTACLEGRGYSVR